MKKEQRTQDEVIFLQRVTKDLKYFKQLLLNTKYVKKGLHEEACKYISYAKFNAGDLIFKESDQTNGFYIILQGKIIVYQSKQFLEIEAQQLQNEYESLDPLQQQHHQVKLISKLIETRRCKSKSQQQLHISRLRQIPAYKAYLKETGGIFPDEFNDLEYFFYHGVFTQNYIITQEQGDVFGELGLILEQERSASVFAPGTVELGLIEGSNYKMILQSVQLMSIRKRLKFLNQYFLPDLPLMSGTIYAYNFKKEIHTKHSIIYKQNEEATTLYIIKKGEIETHLIQDDQKIKIARMGVGQLFGEFEHFHQTNRQYTATVVSEQVSLLSLPYFQLEKMLIALPELNQFIESQINQKKELIKQQIKRTTSFKINKNIENIQPRVKHSEPNPLIRRLNTQIKNQRKKGMIPTEQTIMVQQQQLHQSLQDIQTAQYRLKKLIFQKVNLLPQEEEFKLKENLKKSQIVRQFFNDRDTSNVNRKDIISYQLSKSKLRTNSRFETDSNTQGSVTKFHTEQMSDQKQYSQYSQSPVRRRIMVCSKHNQFRQKPIQQYLYFQNYTSNSRNE